MRRKGYDSAKGQWDKGVTHRESASDDRRRRAIGDYLDGLVEGSAEEVETWVRYGSVERPEQRHDTDLKQHRKFQAGGPILHDVSSDQLTTKSLTRGSSL